MKIITGSTGQTHVTSGNDGEFNQMILGTGLVVFPNGNKLEATQIDNNTIRIKDGDLCFQGRHALIEPDTTEDITIETGAVDKKRIDLIVAHYELNNSTGYEKLELKVLKGEETEGEPVAPTVTTGDIRRGALVAEVAMWKVTVDNVLLTNIEQLFTPSLTLLEAVDAKVQEAQEAVEEVEEALEPLTEINTFDLVASTWASNTDTATKTALPYIYTISSSEYTATSTPLWCITGATNVSGVYASSAEADGANAVKQVLFSASSITLYATEKPTVALKLMVKGK